MANILIVEDSEFDCTLLKKALGSEHNFVWASTIDAAKSHLAKTEPDMVILDLMLEGGSGLELCTLIRGTDSMKNLPIMIISAKSQTHEKVMGLQLGADDYLTKPFEPLELRARVDRKLQSVQSLKKREQTRTIGPLKLSLDTARAYLIIDGNDKNIDLTPTEFRILWTLSKRDGQLYSRDQLIDAAYGETHYVTPRTVDSHIRSLRNKLNKFSEIVETVYGNGYRFNSNLLNQNN